MSHVNDTFLEVVEEENGTWSVIDEHGNPILSDIDSECAAIADMKELQICWHRQRLEDGDIED